MVYQKKATCFDKSLFCLGFAPQTLCWFAGRALLFQGFLIRDNKLVLSLVGMVCYNILGLYVFDDKDERKEL